MKAKLMRAAVIGLGALALSAPGMALAATTIENTDTGGSVASFGRPNTLTYGQVFVAPVTGVLSSFTFWLNGAIQNVSGAVGTWNDPDNAFSLGHGSPLNLFLGTPMTANGETTFGTGGVSVIAGQRYVAYMTVFGNPGPLGTTSIDLGSAAPNLNYFVFQNSDNPHGDPTWNYFSLGNARFRAVFDDGVNGAVPEPGTWAMMLIGFAFAGAALRRRKGKVTTSVRYA